LDKEREALMSEQELGDLQAGHFLEPLSREVQRCRRRARYAALTISYAALIA
jgi:hypothetical protein